MIVRYVALSRYVAVASWVAFWVRGVHGKEM